MTVIYNKTTGNLILTTSETIESVSSIVFDIPDGYTVKSVNTETGEPVFEPIPKTDEQKQIDDLKKTVAQLQEAAALQQQITDAIIGADETESEGTV